MHKNKHLTLLILLLFFFGWNVNSQDKKMHPKNEFRGVWIATVVNIDVYSLNRALKYSFGTPVQKSSFH